MLSRDKMFYVYPRLVPAENLRFFFIELAKKQKRRQSSLRMPRIIRSQVCTRAHAYTGNTGSESNDGFLGNDGSASNDGFPGVCVCSSMGEEKARDVRFYIIFRGQVPPWALDYRVKIVFDPAVPLDRAHPAFLLANTQPPETNTRAHTHTHTPRNSLARSHAPTHSRTHTGNDGSVNNDGYLGNDGTASNDGFVANDGFDANTGASDTTVRIAFFVVCVCVCVSQGVCARACVCAVQNKGMLPP